MATDALMLAPHAYFCRSGDQLVFLDLKQNRYFAVLSRDDSSAASMHDRTRDLERLTLGPRARRVVHALLTRQLLTTDRSYGKEALATLATPPCATLVSEDPRRPARPPARYVGTFLLASMVASWLLRRTSLLEIAKRMRTRKSRVRFADGFNGHRASELVAAFDALRPFLFTAQDRCLYHSLALIEFLARYELYPDWVFGVRTEPFRAHCWVQHESIVLNDYPERVGGFTPIMVL